jgi:large repetitive protein
MMSEAKVVGGDEDVILQILGVQGFQMKVKANSVTFPDGSRIGTLVLSPVTPDRLPMTPPTGGALFGVPAWTVQPAASAATRFPVTSTAPTSCGSRNTLPGLSAACTRSVRMFAWRC